jgi:hypothetical protein
MADPKLPWGDPQPTQGEGITWDGPRAPTLVANDYDIATRGLMDGAVSDQQLLDNTIKFLSQKYTVVPITPEGMTYPAKLQLIDKEGKVAEFDVQNALVSIYRKAQYDMQRRAEDQPEFGTKIERAAASFKTPMGAMNYLKSRHPNAEIFPAVTEDGEMTGNYILREPGKEPQIFNSSSLNANDLFGLLGEVPGALASGAGAYLGGSIAGAAGPGAAVGGATIGAGIGAGVGNAAKQFLGGLLPGSDEVSGSDRAKEVGQNMMLGATGEVLAGPIGAGARAVARGGPQLIRRLIGALPEAPGVAMARRAAAERTAAAEIVVPAERLGMAGRIRESITKARDTIKTLTPYGNAKEPVWFSPAEASSSREGLATQRTMTQTPGMTDAMSDALQDRYLRVAQSANGIVNSIAANPERLGRPEVGRELVTTLNTTAREAIRYRSKMGGPLYDAAIKANGGARVVPTNSTMEELDKALSAAKMNPGLNVGAQKFMSSIAELGTGTGRVSVEAMQNMRSFFGSIVRREQKVPLLEGLSEAAQVKMARNVLKGIDEDLATAAASAQGEGAQLLKKANSVWAELSQPINELDTTAIKDLLRVEKKGGVEMVTPKIARMSIDERAGLMKILDERAPDLAKDVRAQLLLDRLEKGGVKRMATEQGAEMAAATPRSAIGPGKLASMLHNDAEYLASLYGRDPKTWRALLALGDASSRLAKTPGWGDSGTAANLFNQLVRSPGISSTVGKALLDAGAKLARNRLMDPASMFRAIATREGAENVTRLMMSMQKLSAPGAKKEAIKAFITSVNTMSLEVALGGIEQKPMVSDQ